MRNDDSSATGATTAATTDFSTISADAALSTLDASRSGLSSAEASDRLSETGPNRIARVGRVSPVMRYLAQFRDWLVLLLLACAVVVSYLGDWSTAVVLVVLVLINTTIGFVQEARAERTMQALEALVTPTTDVLRDGRITEVDTATLVPGDVVHLAEGDSVPADMRVIEAQALSANEFALTGESNPTRKTVAALEYPVPLADRRNLLFTGTDIGTGEAFGVVIATGMRTELGRIARLSDQAPTTPSPLQREMSTIARVIGIAVAVLAAVLLVFAVIAQMPFREALLFAVGLACALVPQGLPAEVNTALAQASETLARRRALVKKLSAVETLGATHVICTDKTGTLTRNEMTVVSAEIGFAPFTVTGSGYAPDGEIHDVQGARITPTHWQRVFAETGVLAGNARLLRPDDEHPDWHVLGDPTEGALLPFAVKAGVDLEALQRNRVEEHELPFDSERKRMTSVRRVVGAGPARHVAYVKGAPESLLDVCTRVLDGDTVRPITDDDRSRFLEAQRRAAGQALRNLAFAVRDVTSLVATTPADTTASTLTALGIEDVEHDLLLLGFVSMRDPLRDEVPGAMAETRAAGINVSIVTGDSALTAAAIAKMAGLADQAGRLAVVTGDQLRTMADAEVLRHALGGGVVFSRVAPEDKMRIVTLVRDSGHVVAVTGDGINDAPALRSANIGVAMGRTGTDVAKQAAEVVLLDDSFATLVHAIGQGRTIYTNISRGVLSCLTSNVGEFVVSMISLALTTLLGLPLAINVLQILAVDVLGEIIPISALGSDRAEGENMRRPPRDPKARILQGHSITDVVFSGTVMGVLAALAYLVAYPLQGLGLGGGGAAEIAAATTVTYATILLTQLVNIVHRRSVHGIFSRHQLTNRWFWLACLLAIVVMLVIVYVPFVGAFFGTAPLTPALWLPPICAMVVMGLAREGFARATGHRV
ncbi:cation-translocating P-type ATPase [Pseudoclavibacter sp. 13-3]|uniref:cation-translocating P-type ATPase n=1 Tax=Pseudoclavibacter sp. 13-3 TaxID=2901228 RepID=UPI001E425EDB|nr:cation-transporting P-type ATPase [Pseudoclavibacter sp. 13-3]MCD7101688.1 cation-transporting P-type ATPase [Pseudoclavibacter sp. 13-3]